MAGTIILTVSEMLLYFFGGLYHYYEKYSIETYAKVMSDVEENRFPSVTEDGEVSSSSPSLYNSDGSYYISAFIDTSSESVEKMAKDNRIKETPIQKELDDDAEALFSNIAEELHGVDPEHQSEGRAELPEDENLIPPPMNDEAHDIVIHNEDIIRDVPNEEEERPPSLDIAMDEFTQITTSSIEDGELGWQKWSGMIVGIEGSNIHFTDKSQRIWVKVKKSYAKKLHIGNYIVLEVKREIHHTEVLSVVRLEEDFTALNHPVNTDENEEEDYAS